MPEMRRSLVRLDDLLVEVLVLAFAFGLDDDNSLEKVLGVVPLSREPWRHVFEACNIKPYVSF